MRQSLINSSSLVFLLLGMSLLAGSVPAVELRSNEWYLRLSITNSDENLIDNNNLLGQLKESLSGYDSHDLIELPPFAAPYLTLVFPHPDWEEKAGNYATDFHQRKGWRQVWYFEVHSDDAGRDITLSWALTSNTKTRRNMWLVDGVTGEVIRANSRNHRSSAVSEYSFNMDGQTSHSFYWVQGSRRHAKEQIIESQSLIRSR